MFAHAQIHKYDNYIEEITKYRKDYYRLCTTLLVCLNCRSYYGYCRRIVLLHIFFVNGGGGQLPPFPPPVSATDFDLKNVVVR